jgi:hypothetical protein
MTKGSNINKIVYQIYNPFSEYDIVREIWISLLKKCPHSYFLSWAWKERWLKSLHADCKLFFIAGFYNKLPVLAFFVGSKTSVQHKVFKIHHLSLNQTLIPSIDQLTIEYNAILIDPEITISFESLLNLMPIKWDEFRMMRCATQYQSSLLFNHFNNAKYILSIKKLKSYYVTLDKVRLNNNDYLVILSSNKRNQIRRSVKEYEKMGKLKMNIPENVHSAMKIFDELIQLNQKQSNKRELPGAFTNEYIINFHKYLITERFAHGEVQLIRISAGEHTIGCLYSFVYDGAVLYYQGGFNYLAGNVYRPGLICHYLAIEHNAAAGLNSYDFLEGEEEYKKSLATNETEMLNVIIQKNDMKHKLETLIVNLYQSLKKGY